MKETGNGSPATGPSSQLALEAGKAAPCRIFGAEKEIE